MNKQADMRGKLRKLGPSARKYWKLLTGEEKKRFAQITASLKKLEKDITWDKGKGFIIDDLNREFDMEKFYKATLKAQGDLEGATRNTHIAQIGTASAASKAGLVGLLALYGKYGGANVKSARIPILQLGKKLTLGQKLKVLVRDILSTVGIRDVSQEAFDRWLKAKGGHLGLSAPGKKAGWSDLRGAESILKGLKGLSGGRGMWQTLGQISPQISNRVLDGSSSIMNAFMNSPELSKHLAFTIKAPKKYKKLKKRTGQVGETLQRLMANPSQTHPMLATPKLGDLL